MFLFKENLNKFYLVSIENKNILIKKKFLIKKKILKYKGYLSNLSKKNSTSLNKSLSFFKKKKIYKKKNFFFLPKLIWKLTYRLKMVFSLNNLSRIKKKINYSQKLHKNFMDYYRRFFFKKHYFTYLKNKNIYLNSTKIHLTLNKGKKIKFFYFILHNFFDNIFSNFHLFNIIYLYKYSYFREKNFNLLVRYNFNLKKYFFIKNNVSFIFEYAYFPKFYSKKLINEFTFMCFTKSLQNFSIFIKKLITNLGRIGQKKFYHIFSGINGPVLISFLKKLFIFGFYLKSSGKIAGYAGDRTKLFYVRFGNYSRAIKHLRFLYKQTISFTKPGAIGTNFLLVFS